VGRNGDSDPDDYGLPPVDIAIPDDARELDGDILAYRREMRQKRLHRRLRRLAAPFTRYGIAAPFIAAALLVSLTGATLMAVFASRPSRSPQQPSSTTDPPPTRQPYVRQPPGRPRPGAIGAPLPDRALSLVGRRDVPRRLRDLRPAIIALVPANCRCDRRIAELAERGTRQRIAVYLVTPGPPGRSVRSLAGGDAVRAAEDSEAALFSAYRPDGLTAVLVHSDGVVGDVRRDVNPAAVPDGRLARLREPA
jgi:hypothetical protein